MKTIETKVLKSGNKAGLVMLDNGGYLVYMHRVNYSQGREVGKWRVVQTSIKQSYHDFQSMVENGLSEAEARKLYNKKR